jgi:hypothetical protein
MDGKTHYVAARRENTRIAAAEPVGDAQALVEFECECSNFACERSVKVPLYVYRRILESKDQVLLQAGHHAPSPYRTIVSMGLMSIEERV